MKALVIESGHRIARSLKLGLESLGLGVDLFFDYESSKSKLDTEYDVAIIDGGADGLNIIREMRAAGNHAPIVALGSRKSAAERSAALNAGADEYVPKPFVLMKLLSVVRALIPSLDEHVLKAADLTLDSKTYEVTRGGKPIILTTKEFLLLELLLRNQGRPTSKDAIAEYVWPFGAEVLPNTIEVYMKYLRMKMDEPFEKRLIGTMRGFGYKLEA